MPSSVREKHTGVVIVCSRGRATKRCAFCADRAGLLCDGPTAGGGKSATCDKPICRRCATHVGPERDLCPDCVRADRQLVLPGSK